MPKKMLLTQAVCLFIILLSCLSLGFGSWLETNNLLYSSSPSVNRQLSVFKINLVTRNNESSTALLTFGLWRYCIYRSLDKSNKCSPIRLNFDIDTSSAINSILTKNYNQLPSPSISYVRVIPLILATFIGVVTFGIALFLLPGNNKKSVQRKALLWLKSLLCLISASLTAISFGVTFYQYSSDIKKVCSSSKSEYICQSYTPSVEIILLGLAVGLFTFSSIYCIIIASLLNTHLSDGCETQYTNNSSYSFYATGNEGTQSNQDIEEKQPSIASTGDFTIDELGTVWNVNKERLSLRPPPPNINHKQQRAGCRSSSDNNSPLKLDEKVTNIVNSNADLHSVKPRLATNSASLATSTLIPSTTDIKYTSSTSFDEDVLRPPTLPFANSGRPTSNHKNNRPLSYDSGNTFGAFCNSQPNSPSGDDLSLNSATSYMDHHYHRNDSVSSHTNSHLMYATSGTGGTQSNHTLGTFPLHNTRTAGSDNYVLYNSSFEEEDGRFPIPPPHNTSSNSLTIENATCVQNDNIPDQRNVAHHDNNNSNNKTPSSSVNTTDQLHKRINDYLQKK